MHENKINENINILNKARDYFMHALNMYENKKYIDAEKFYLKSLELAPNRLSTFINLSAVLIKLEKFNNAYELLTNAILLYPNNEVLHLNLGNSYKEMGRLDEALQSFNYAIKINYDYAEAHLNRGVILQEMGKWDKALASFNKAIELNSNYAESYYCRGLLMEKLKHFDDALENFKIAIKIKDDLENLPGELLHLKMNMSIWEDYELNVSNIIQKIENNHRASPTFPILGITDSLTIHQKTTELWVKETYIISKKNKDKEKFKEKNKITIGYYSADFKEHPVSYLIAGVLESHDREKFSILGFSLKKQPQSEIRNRLIKSFDKFIEVEGYSDLEIADLSKSLGVDIAVDLQGHTQGNRFGIFKYRAAPIQVNYLGYPGTLGSFNLDYIIADLNVIPVKSQKYYSEKICYLPYSYMPFDNSNKKNSKNSKFNRYDLGLPENKLVLASFNNSYKITPNIFKVWMSLLNKIENSVLWLAANNKWSVSNLINESQKWSIDPSRIIFAQRLTDVVDHLERQKFADLMLDTSPYNGHTTTIDALWSGVPVISVEGEGFQSRVAGSLLKNLGLGELVAHSQTDYEAKAIELSKKPEKIESIKKFLKNEINVNPLFNTKLYTGYLENAYSEMLARHIENLPPEHIYVNK